MTAPITIPARISAQDLARAIERDVSEVQAVLIANNEPASPEEVLSAELAEATARALGAEVLVEARDLALECLYGFETGGEPCEEDEGRASRLFEGVVSNLEHLDGLISSVSEHWSVARMPLIDRNILRLGLYELENEPRTPAAVILSEAVRLAQTYSTERSASFVNGVLATLARSVRDE